MRDIETESFTIKRTFNLYWNDISAAYLGEAKDSRLIVGHEKGIIVS